MRCRVEELPFLADYARDNFVRDQADFIAHSPEYETDFLTKYDPQVKLVRDWVATSALLAEQKKLTERIKNQYTSARNWVNKVEDYAKKASASLKTNIEDFGFKPLREEIHSTNDEGTIKQFRELLQHIDANIDVLTPKGLTTAVRTELKTFVDTFETDIKSQSRKMDQRKNLVQSNNKVYKTLWLMISEEILDTGKTIFKEKDKEKVKDYTFSELMKKVRIAHKAAEEEKKAEEVNTGETKPV